MASLDEIRSERIKKIETLKEKGIYAYPIDTEKNIDIASLTAEFDELVESKKVVTVAGRVMAVRAQGAIAFFNLNDGTGSVQGLIKKGEVPAEQLDLFFETIDIGDFIEATGDLFLTKRGEKTVAVKDWKILSKSLRPLPDKWHGLQDTEERFRRRYLDSLMDPEVRERFAKRSNMITEIRNILNKDGYLEVETPILQPLAGGATAQPFTTHHNALDIDLNLRIAPELYLKKMMIGGFPKVYEMSRNFRNEGIDATHNPEFTMLEFYEAFSNAKKQMAFVEKLFKAVVKKVTGGDIITFDGNEINFAEKFKVVSYGNLIKQYAFINDILDISRDEVALKASQFGVDVAPTDAVDKIIDNIYKKVCRPKLVQPTFIIDYPVAFSPFAKKKEDDPRLIDRFQLVIGGMEMVNAFSELNDPLDQRERYVEQDKKRKQGEAEVSPSDEDFLEAMEYGMPPAGGVGIGIDRVAMLLTNTQNIKEVIYFPTMKPQN